MLIFNENNKPEIIDNIYSPTLSNYFWTLDLNIDGEGDMDFTLAPIVMFEEITGPTLLVAVNGFAFYMPAHWNILVFDEETSEIDVVIGEELLGNDFTALVYGMTANLAIAGQIQVLDYDAQSVVVAPALNKHQMMCHPITPEFWINVAPTDTYNKYLKDKSIGDII